MESGTAQRFPGQLCRGAAPHVHCSPAPPSPGAVQPVSKSTEMELISFAGACTSSPWSCPEYHHHSAAEPSTALPGDPRPNGPGKLCFVGLQQGSVTYNSRLGDLSASSPKKADARGTDFFFKLFFH